MSESIPLIIAAVCSLIGALFFLASAIGLLRLPDFYTRVHAPTKAATLGILFMALGSMIVHLGSGRATWLEDLLLVLFVFLTVPVSSQMLIRAGAARGLPQIEKTRGVPLRRPIEHVDENVPEA